MYPLSETRECVVCLQTQCLSDGAFRTMNSFVGAFALWVWGPRERCEDRAGAELVAGWADRALLRASPGKGRWWGHPRGEGTSGRLRVWRVGTYKDALPVARRSGSAARVEADFLLRAPALQVMPPPG